MYVRNFSFNLFFKKFEICFYAKFSDWIYQIEFSLYRAKENAAMACRDSKDYEKAKELYGESVDEYFASGSVTTAAQTLEKAAKMLEPFSPESAIQVC